MCLHDNVMIFLKKTVLSWHDCILFPTILVKSQVIDTIQDEILRFYVCSCFVVKLLFELIYDKNI